MPRLRYQKKAFLYEVISVIDYDRMGKKRYKTYYGRDYEVPRSEIIRIARENIKKKFEDSSGKIISISISKVYK